MGRASGLCRGGATGAGREGVGRAVVDCEVGRGGEDDLDADDVGEGERVEGITCVCDSGGGVVEGSPLRASFLSRPRVYVCEMGRR